MTIDELVKGFTIELVNELSFELSGSYFELQKLIQRGALVHHSPFTSLTLRPRQHEQVTFSLKGTQSERERKESNLTGFFDQLLEQYSPIDDLEHCVRGANFALCKMFANYS